MAKQYFIGVDVGGTNVDALLVDQVLEAQAFFSAPIRPYPNADPAEVITTVIEKLLARGGVTELSQVVSIGVGIPGLVDAANGRVELAVNLAESSMPLGELLAEHFRVPVAIENDANAIALGASHFLVKQEIKNLAFITLGTGVGAGLVLDGQIFHGSQNMAGEIGHMFYRESDIRCQCGAYGCLETFVAGPAITRMARQAAANDPHTTLKNYDHPDAAAVFTEATRQDSAAQQIATEVGTILARAIQGMIMSFDLEKIIIGGGIAQAGDALLDPILAEWADHETTFCHGNPNACSQ